MNRIETEKQTVAAMIRLYCIKNHGYSDLCNECYKLQFYAEQRLDKCQFGEEKKVCAKCPVHCYKPDMRLKIKEVMRFSGPRMILYHPVMVLEHIIHKRITGMIPQGKPWTQKPSQGTGYYNLRFQSRHRRDSTYKFQFTSFLKFESHE